MYCPECGTEYRAGFTECADCRVALAPERPPDPEPAADPDLELVTVWEGFDPLLVVSAESLLEGAGIPFFIAGAEMSARYGPVSPFVHPARRFQVARDREREARELLSQLDELGQAGAPGQPEAPDSEI